MHSNTGSKKQLREAILTLLIPVLIEQTFITLMDVINAMMAGHIGKEATAAIGMVDMLNNIFVGLFSSLAIGGTVIVAHYTGQQNYKHSGEASKQAIYAGVILAALITVCLGICRRPLLGFLYGAADRRVLHYAVSYLMITLMTYPLIAFTSVACGVLRGAGDTRTPAKVVIFMNIMNIIFSYLLIFGFAFHGPFLKIHLAGLGVRGAALGIAIARFSGALVLIYVLARGSLNLKVERLYRFRPDWELLKSIFNIGMPAGLESLLFNAGKLITQTFIVASGTVAIVANYVGMSIHGMMVLPGVAFSLAAPAVIGQNMGRADRDGARESLFYMNKLATIALVVLNLVCLPLFAFFGSLYTPNSEVIAEVTRLLRWTALFVACWPISFILPAGFKGAGDVKYTLIVSVLSMWVLRITLGYLLGINWKLGVLGIWLGMYADWIVRGIIFALRSRGERWQGHVVVKALKEMAL